MITRSFTFIPGIGPITQRKLREVGILSWNDFFSKKNTLDLSENIIGKIESYIRKAQTALKNSDIEFFLELLKRRDLWLLYRRFRSKFLFFDIETTGLSHIHHDITLIGLFNRGNMRVYIKGKNLDRGVNEIRKYPIVVTFNGALFDLRFLRTKYPEYTFPKANIDLRFLLARLGYSGGLKAIEKQLDIFRDEDVRRVSGYDATILWSKYLLGDMKALQLLIKYNIYDVLNLELLLKIAYKELAKREYPLVQKKIYSDFKMSRKKIYIQEIFNKQLQIDDKILSFPIPRKVNLIAPLLRKLKRKYKRYPIIIGIDLTASKKRKSGVAILEGYKVTTYLLDTDNAILKLVESHKPDLVSIDSPLTLPEGCKSVNDVKNGITRECERRLKREGISVFWCLLPSMRKLTARGIRLAGKLRKRKIKVIESFPGAAQDILQIPRKKAGIEVLHNRLADLGFKDIKKHNMSHDELDAVTSALVGYYYLADKYEALGNKKENYLIVPKP